MSKSTTVEMILKARDEASLTLKEIAALTNTLAKGQKELADGFDDAGRAGAQLEQALNKVGRANKSVSELAKSLDQLAATRSKLSDLGSEAEQLKVKLSGIDAAIADARSRGVDPKVLADMAKLGEAATRTTERIRQAEARLAGLGGKIIGGTATDTQRASFDQVRAKIAELEQDYRIITREAEKAGAALKNSLGPVPNELQASLNKAQGELRKTEAALDKTAYSASRLEAEMAEAGVDTRDLGAAQQQLAGSAARLKQSQDQVAAATKRASSAQQEQATDSRTALNVTQRLRGQVLSLVSAYIGLYGAARQVGEVFNAASRIEGVQSRFNVSFGGDLARTADEMRFVRQEGERLALNWVGLGESYSRFLTSLPPGAMAMEDTRQVFTGFATAARVARLSTDNVDGIFVALTQMASKGTVSMEELRQQLGDRLPGAVNIFAEAAGFGQDEIGKFFKAVEQSQVPASVMVKAAEIIAQRYGGELPGALDSASAALGRFENAVTEVRVAAAESGFLDTLSKALNDLAATLQDPASQESLVAIASGIGGLIKGAVALAPYIVHLVGLFAAMQAIKVAAWMTTITTAFKVNGVAAKTYTGTIGKLQAAVIGYAKGITTVGAALNRLVWPVAAIVTTTALIKGLAEVVDIYTSQTVRAEGARRALGKVLSEPFDGNPYKDIQERSAKDLKEMQADLRAYRAGVEQALATMALKGPVDPDVAEAARARSQELLDVLVKVNKEIKSRPQAEVDGSIKASEDSIQSFIAAMQGLADQSLENEVRKITQAFDDTVAGLDRAQAGAGAYVRANQDRLARLLALEEQYGQSSINIASKNAEAKLMLLEEEKLAGQELLQEQRNIALEVADVRIAATKKAMDMVVAEIDRAKQAERSYAAEVASLQDKIADERSRQADQVVDASGAQSVFLQYQRLYEQRQRMAQLAADTERALEEGNFKRAEELARKRNDLATKLADAEIKSATTGASIVSNEQARAEALREIKASNEQITRAMEGQRDSAEQAAQSEAEIAAELVKRLGELNATFAGLQDKKIDLSVSVNSDDLTAALDAIRADAANVPLQVYVVSNADELKAKLKELEQPTESVHTIRLEVDTSGIPRGIIDFSGFASGGPVPGFASGGKINGPGTSTSDSILARLSRGEYVIKASAVNYWGEDMMHAMNNMRRFPGYADGGLIGSPPKTPAEIGGSGDTVTLNLRIDGREAGELTGDRDVVDTLLNALKRLT